MFPEKRSGATTVEVALECLMDDVIKTKSVGDGIADVEQDFILCEEAMSRLVFRAQIHRSGIRGRIIRQRRESPNDEWVPDEAIDIRTLGKKESFNVVLNTEAVKNLYTAIERLAGILRERGVEYGENTYAVVDPETVIITDENKTQYVKKVLDAGYNEEVWAALADSNPTLVTKLSFAQVQSKKREIIDRLVTRLQTGGYSETSGSNSWQRWIYDHNWLFGVNYEAPIEKAKINLTGIMPDYLFPTLDGFVDILEIKLPEDEVLLLDSSHPGSWRWSAEANKALGQVVNYLGGIDRLRFEIERNVRAVYGREICLLKPRAYILIGDSKNWTSDKKEGLRKMSHALHGIEVITYNDLLNRGNESIRIMTDI